MTIDKIREAFPHLEWKQYGSFVVTRTEYWILSVAVSFPDQGYLASFSETSSRLRLPPASSYKTCAIEAVKDVLQKVQQNIKLKTDQFNKLSEELRVNRLNELPEESK